MSETNIFNCMQIEIMKLNASEILDLLEASIKGIQKISSSTPEFVEVLRKLPNNFTNEDSKALNSLFENVKSPYLNNAIKKEDSGISLLLKGGAPGTPGTPGTPDQSSQTMVHTGFQPAETQRAVGVPGREVTTQDAAKIMTMQSILNFANDAKELAQAGLKPDQIYEILIKKIDVVNKFADSEGNETLAKKTEAEANLAGVITIQSNQLFGQRLSGAGFAMSFLVPGVILYNLQGLLDRIATAAVQTVGTVAAASVGAAELGARNAPAYMFQVVRTGVTAFRDYIPDTAFSFFQTISQSVRSSGVDAFAQTSVSGAFVESVATTTATNTSSAILVGCLLVWLALSLVIVLFTAFIVKVLTGDFAAYMSLGPFGFIGFRPPRRGGNRFTRNNRQMKRHRKHKKTHKRSK
jgi:hypothetical protein